jgi:enamine deaminase RidA (YjgF/YER057c/UK114 family)
VWVTSGSRPDWRSATWARYSKAAGTSFADVVKLTYFVRDIEAVGAIRAARDEFVNTANPPASTLVEVSRLFVPELLIEIEAVAMAPQPGE